MMWCNKKWELVRSFVERMVHHKLSGFSDCGGCESWWRRWDKAVTTRGNNSEMKRRQRKETTTGQRKETMTTAKGNNDRNGERKQRRWCREETLGQRNREMYFLFDAVSFISLCEEKKTHGSIWDVWWIQWSKLRES